MIIIHCAVIQQIICEINCGLAVVDRFSWILFIAVLVTSIQVAKSKTWKSDSVQHCYMIMVLYVAINGLVVNVGIKQQESTMKSITCM